MKKRLFALLLSVLCVMALAVGCGSNDSAEETGKVSVAKDGTLIADVREDVLKKILISNIVTKRLNEAKEKKERKSLKETIKDIFKKD